MYIVIAGCGRVGANLATELSMDDHDVVVIDRDPDSFARLGRAFGGVTVVGTTIDEGVLKDANVNRADVFAAVTDNDAANVMAAQIAKQIFRVPKTIARITDPDREEAYQGLGIVTICPNRMGVYATKASILANGCLRLLPLSDGLEVLQVTARREWVGQPIHSLAKELGVVVSAVLRQGHAVMIEETMAVEPNDQLIMTGRVQNLRAKHKRPSWRN